MEKTYTRHKIECLAYALELMSISGSHDPEDFLSWVEEGMWRYEHIPLSCVVQDVEALKADIFTKREDLIRKSQLSTALRWLLDECYGLTHSSRDIDGHLAKHDIAFEELGIPRLVFEEIHETCHKVQHALKQLPLNNPLSYADIIEPFLKQIAWAKCLEIIRHDDSVPVGPILINFMGPTDEPERAYRGLGVYGEELDSLLSRARSFTFCIPSAEDDRDKT